MVLNFTVNQAMYLAFARGEAEPLARALQALPGDPARTASGRTSCATTTS